MLQVNTDDQQRLKVCLPCIELKMTSFYQLMSPIIGNGVVIMKLGIRELEVQRKYVACVSCLLLLH